jgi:hypothetical protein
LVPLDEGPTRPLAALFVVTADRSKTMAAHINELIQLLTVVAVILALKK